MSKSSCKLSARQEEGRAEIMEAAAQFIAAHGFHGMSMRELARATGKGLASLYNYFASKDDVLYALQLGAFRQLIDSAEVAVAEHHGPSARLYAFILNHVRYVADNPDVMRVLVNEAATLPRPQRQKVRDLKERYFALGRELVHQIMLEGCRAPGAAGQPASGDAEIDRATYTIFGMLNWVYGWYAPDDHGTPADVARTIHRLTLCGLVAQCSARPELATVEQHLNAHPPASLIRPSFEERG